MKPGDLSTLTKLFLPFPELASPHSPNCYPTPNLTSTYEKKTKKNQALQLSLPSPTPKPCSVFLTSLVTLWSLQNRAPTQVSVIKIKNKKFRWLFNKAWLQWCCSISLILLAADVTTWITATISSNGFPKRTFLPTHSHNICAIPKQPIHFFPNLKSLPGLCRNPDWRWH